MTLKLTKIESINAIKAFIITKDDQRVNVDHSLYRSMIESLLFLSSSPLHITFI